MNVVWTFSGHTQTFVEDANQTIYIENDNGNGNNLILGLTSNGGDRGFISVSEGGGGTGAELLLDQAFSFGNLGALGNDLILAGTIENRFPSIQGSGLGTSLKITSFSENFTFNIQPLNTVPEPQYYVLLALLVVIWRSTNLRKKKIQKS